MNVETPADPIQAQPFGGNNRLEDFNQMEQSPVTFDELKHSERELLVRELLIQTPLISQLFVQAT
jgi:hypothetical protein